MTKPKTRVLKSKSDEVDIIEFRVEVKIIDHWELFGFAKDLEEANRVKKEAERYCDYELYEYEGE